MLKKRYSVEMILCLISSEFARDSTRSDVEFDKANVLLVQPVAIGLVFPGSFL